MILRDLLRGMWGDRALITRLVRLARGGPCLASSLSMGFMLVMIIKCLPILRVRKFLG